MKKKIYEELKKVIENIFVHSEQLVAISEYIAQNYKRKEPKCGRPNDFTGVCECQEISADEDLLKGLCDLANEHSSLWVISSYIEEITKSVRERKLDAEEKKVCREMLCSNLYCLVSVPSEKKKEVLKIFDLLMERNR